MRKSYSSNIESKEINKSAQESNRPNKAKDFGSDLYEIAHKYAELLKENQELKSELEKVQQLKNLCHEYNESFKVQSTLSGIFIRSKMSFGHVIGANLIADLLNEIITKK